MLFVLYPRFSAPTPDFLDGIQGAGKTTRIMVMKDLIDPSSLREGFSMPSKESDFAQIAHHHYFLFFDNLSAMPEAFSDTLARAVTGAGFKQALVLHNYDDVIYRFQRTIAPNSVNQVAYKPDLLDRSILIHLDRISEDKRKPSQLFWAEFERDLPYILGVIFDVLVKALDPTLLWSWNRLLRMADFARWGYAIAEAAGFSGETFIKAHHANIVTQHDEAIEANPAAQVLMEFMKDQEPWTGTASELHALLTPIAFKLGVSQYRAGQKMLHGLAECWKY